MQSTKGEIQNFTGVNAPYEPPLNSDISIDTPKSQIELPATLWEQLKQNHRNTININALRTNDRVRII